MQPRSIASRLSPRTRFLLGGVLATLLVIPVTLNAAASVRDVMGRPSWVGLGLHQYQHFTQAWLAGGQWWLPGQLAGPYVIEQVAANVYPPTLLYLTVPFALGLPEILWWLVPGALLVAAYRRLGVGWQAGLLTALAAAAMDRTWTVVVLGNPAIWALAGAVAGIAWGWPAVGALLKTTFVPLALLGIRRRSWWWAMGVALLAALPFGTMWLDYVTVLRNASTSRGSAYVLGEWPIALVLVGVALWAAWRRSAREAVA